MRGAPLFAARSLLARSRATSAFASSLARVLRCFSVIVVLSYLFQALQESLRYVVGKPRYPLQVTWSPRRREVLLRELSKHDRIAADDRVERVPQIVVLEPRGLVGDSPQALPDTLRQLVVVRLLASPVAVEVLLLPP